MLKRPMLYAALAFILGELLMLAILPKILRLLLLLVFIIPVFYRYSQKRISGGFLFLMLIIPLFSAAHYRKINNGLIGCQDRLASFGKHTVALEGRVHRLEYSDKKTVLILDDCRLSNGYGSIDTLPKDASPLLRERYGKYVGRVQVYMDGEGCIYPGQDVRFIGRLMQGEHSSNEGQFSYMDYLSALGISGAMSATELSEVSGRTAPYRRLIQDTRIELQELLRRHTLEEDNGIYQAILLGARKDMDKGLQELYRKNGIAHILAVSGLHLSMLGMGFHSILRALCLPLLPANIIGAIAVISYAVLTGSSASALRAAAMLILKFLSVSAGRSYDMLSALSLSAVLLLVDNPMLIAYPGFQLSFAAVLSIGLFSELPIPEIPALKGFLISLCLQLFLLPITLFHFFAIPLYGLALNLLVLPLFTLLLSSGVFGLGLAWISELLLRNVNVFFWEVIRAAVSGLSGLLGGISELLFYSGHNVLGLYSRLCSIIELIPNSYLTLGRPGIWEMSLYYALLLLLGMLIRRWGIRSRAAAITSVLFIMSTLLLPVRAPGGLLISALYVGQGDGFIIRQGGRVISIDCGSSSDRSMGENLLRPYLMSQGIGCIDIAFISHSDNDHTSGILALLNEGDIEIERLALPSVAFYDERYDRLRELAEIRGCELIYISSGTRLRLERNQGLIWGDKNELSLLCYFPYGNDYMEDANSHSTGLLLSYGEFKMLFTGDMPGAQEMSMLSAMEELGGAPDIDILKLGHHGSSTSTTAELLSGCRPEYGLISCGRGNSYGHPHRETMERLSEFSVKALETASMGEIRIKSDGSSYSIYAPYAFME